jgi:hypothetical protein
VSNDSPIFSIFFHNYYGNDKEWAESFLKEASYPFNLLYNTVAGSYYRTEQTYEWENFKNRNPRYLVGLCTTNSTNKGKDIGGKMVLMDAYLKLSMQCQYILLLHDKHSPYHYNNQQWQEDLLKIASSKYLHTMAAMFSKDPKLGIIASKNAIRNELDNEQQSISYISSDLVQNLKSKYGINPPDLQYVAGTMFCVRANLFEDFFTINSPLEIRSTLESGNITDNDKATITHSWERLLCWLVTSKGYQIRGI